MKAYFTTQVTRSIYSEPAIPHWVSEMGLEWFYLLVANSGATKDTARG